MCDWHVADVQTRMSVDEWVTAVGVDQILVGGKN